MKPKKAGQLAAALVMSLASATTLGLDVFATPKLNTWIEASTNQLLLFREDRDTAALVVDAGVELTARSETNSLRLFPRARVSRFSQNQNPDREEYFFSGFFEHRRERLTTFVDTQADRQSVLELEGAQTGFSFSNLNRDTFRVTAGATYSYSERIELGLTASMQDVSYEEAARRLLFDFSFTNVNASATYLLDDKTRLTAQFGYSDFKSPDANGATETLIFQIGIFRALSDTLSIDINAGLNHSSLSFQSFELISVPPFGLIFQGTDRTSNEVGYVVNGVLRKSFSWVDTEFNYSRNLNPSSQGSQSIDESYRFAATKEISKRLSVLTDIQYLDRSSEGPNVTGLDVKLLWVRALLSYELTPNLELQTFYRHRTRSFRDQFAATHELRAQIIYSFEPMRIH